MRYGQERLKDIMKKQWEEDQQQEEKEGVDLIPHEHERAFKGAYKCFVMASKSKKDIHSYFDQTKPHIKTLIKNQVKEMESAKIIMPLWVRWKKPIKPLITTWLRPWRLMYALEEIIDNFYKNPLNLFSMQWFIIYFEWI